MTMSLQSLDRNAKQGALAALLCCFKKKHKVEIKKIHPDQVKYEDYLQVSEYMPKDLERFRDLLCP
jgi:hypothetical protein